MVFDWALGSQRTTRSTRRPIAVRFAFLHVAIDGLFDWRIKVPFFTAISFTTAGHGIIAGITGICICARGGGAGGGGGGGAEVVLLLLLLLHGI